MVARPTCREWLVVGGSGAGGIIVRAGQRLSSPELPTRLAAGSIVEEVELVGDRLHFQRISGTGPTSGWVSINVKGKQLLKIRKDPVAPPASPDANIDEEGWNERERNLWRLTKGKFHPRRTFGRHRPAVGYGGGGTSRSGRVSIVSPTTEGRQQFHQLLWECFHGQDWVDKELVVVETFQQQPSPVLLEISKMDQRLIYVPFQTQPGADWSIGLKRNICTQLATGEFIAHFDDDDLYAPSYVSSLVNEMVLQSACGITLSSWYILDTTTGTIGWCDPLTWGILQDEPVGVEDEEVRSSAYGYGFSYVYTREAALDFPFTDQNLGEDLEFFSSLQRARGSGCVALIEDRYGSCLHTQHRLNTSKAFALWEVPKESLYDLEVTDFYPVFDIYLRMFPQLKTQEGKEESYHLLTSHKRTPSRRYHSVTVHAPARDVEVRCPATATGAELWDLLEDEVGALPVAARAFRIPGQESVPTAVWEQSLQRAMRALWPGAPRLEALKNLPRELCEEEREVLGRAWRSLEAEDRVGTRTKELWLALADGLPAPRDLGAGGRRGLAVHVTCLRPLEPGSVGQHFHVGLPLEATVSELRQALALGLGADAPVLGRLPGEGLRALEDGAAVPCKVVLPKFTGVVKSVMVLTCEQCVELQLMMKGLVSRSEFQRQLDELESHAEKTSARFRMGLASLLLTEIYPILLRHYGLAVTREAQAAMFECLAQHDDPRILALAYELELIMRNETRAAFYRSVMDGTLILPTERSHFGLATQLPQRAPVQEKKHEAKEAVQLPIQA